MQPQNNKTVIQFEFRFYDNHTRTEVPTAKIMEENEDQDLMEEFTAIDSFIPSENAFKVVNLDFENQRGFITIDKVDQIVNNCGLWFCAWKTVFLQQNLQVWLHMKTTESLESIYV